MSCRKITRHLKKKQFQLGFQNQAKVVVKRNVELEKLLLQEASHNPPARRHTVTFDDTEEIFNFNSEIELQPVSPRPLPPIPPKCILKKLKSAPFHVRGRRKSLPTKNHSLVPDDDVVNLDLSNNQAPECSSFTPRLQQSGLDLIAGYESDDSH